MMYRLLFFILSLLISFDAQAEIEKTPSSIDEIRLSYAPIVKKVAPAVVSIYAVQIIERKLHPLFDDDFFNSFFDLSQTPVRQELAKSMGSGVIINKNGTIVTCAHVVQNAKAIEIKLSDNRQLKGKVTAIDEKNDLAVIKILDLHEDIPFTPLGQSSTVQDGDLILAFGNPFGIGHTVTNGIISAATRNVGGRILMQTDAPINPGNSGGALVNMKGELIGIPNAILSRTGTNLGIGFAIPISVITPLLSTTNKNGIVTRAWDGLKIETLDHAKAESFGLKDQKGVIVTAIHPDSPAKAAGLLVSDIITKVNGMPIDSEESYRLKFLEIETDKDVTYETKRNDQTKTISFKTIAPPATPKPEAITLQGRTPLSGITIANLSPALALQTGLDSMQSGVIVTKTPAPRGIAFGIILFQAGDVIEKADGTKVESVKQFINLLKDGITSLTLRRGEQVITIQIRD